MKNLILIVFVPFVVCCLTSIVGTNQSGTFERCDENFSPTFSTPTPTAKTGAPGEGTCNDCHGGTDLDATGVVDFIFPEASAVYTPGTTYDITLDLGAGTKNGFVLTILDNSDNKAGILIPGPGTEVTNSTRDYVTGDGTDLSATSWDFSWTAPATDIGDLKAYFSVNQSDDDGGPDPEDQIWVGEAELFSPSSSAISQYELFDQSLEMRYDQSSHRIVIEYTLFQILPIQFSLFNLGGQLVKSGVFTNSVLGSNQKHLNVGPGRMLGTYIGIVTIDGQLYSRKIQL